MKRLPIVFVTLAVLALALAGCSNPVNNQDATVPAGEFQVFIDMDQAKGLYDYNVMHVYIKGFQISPTGAPIALVNTSTQATTSNGKYLTEMLPVYDEKAGYHDPFTRTQIGYTAWFKFDTGLAPNRALKFVAWAVEYDGEDEQIDASNALREWREQYMKTAECEMQAWAAMATLEATNQAILAKMAEVQAAYEAAGAPYSPYPSWWWAPVLTAVENLNQAYNDYMDILDSQAYVDWLASGVCVAPPGSVENSAASPAAAAKAAYDSAMAAFLFAWSNYSAGTPSYPAEPSQVTDVTYDLYFLIVQRSGNFAALFAAWDCLATTWCEIRDLTAPYSYGAKQVLVMAKKDGEYSGHRVIYHTEADRYFPLPSTGINLYWTKGNFIPGNIGPGGGMVIGEYQSPPSIAPAVGVWDNVNPQKQVVPAQIVEVSLADIATDVEFYYNSPLFLQLDKHINEALDAANVIQAPSPTYVSNGVTGWTLGTHPQLLDFAIWLNMNGYSNGNLLGGNWPLPFETLKKTYYWTWDQTKVNTGVGSGRTGYGRSWAEYDKDGVLVNVNDVQVTANLGFGNAGDKANIRPIMAWGHTSNWKDNNQE